MTPQCRPASNPPPPAWPECQGQLNASTWPSQTSPIFHGQNSPLLLCVSLNFSLPLAAKLAPRRRLAPVIPAHPQSPFPVPAPGLLPLQPRQPSTSSLPPRLFLLFPCVLHRATEAPSDHIRFLLTTISMTPHCSENKIHIPQHGLLSPDLCPSHSATPSANTRCPCSSVWSPFAWLMYLTGPTRKMLKPRPQPHHS